MADESDVLLQLYNEERTQARQMEDQRATLTNIVILVVGAGLAFVTNRGLELATLTVSIPMIGIGLYGVITTAKYFERWFRHWKRADGDRAHLFDMFPDIDSNLSERAGDLTRGSRGVFKGAMDRRFPTLSRLQIYRLWTGLFWAVAAAGAIITVMVLWSSSCVLPATCTGRATK
jgi:hypothetical protein